MSDDALTREEVCALVAGKSISEAAIWKGHDAALRAREAAQAERIERLEAALTYQARCPGCGDTECDLECVRFMGESDRIAAIRDGCEKARAALAGAKGGTNG